MGIAEIITLGTAAYQLYNKIASTVEKSTELTEADKEKFRAAIIEAKEIPQEWDAT